MKTPVQQLEALRENRSLPPRAEKRCVQLIERLRAPVRIGIFGFPGSAKVAVVHALAQASVFGPEPLHAPCQIRYAERGELTVTDPDGSNRTDAVQMPVSLPHSAILAEVMLPLAPLRQMSVLCVATDPEPEEVIAAMRWATPRCDIALWCSRDWTQTERDICQAAPERLKDHAFVVRTCRKPPPVTALTQGPEQIHCPTLDDTPGSALLVPSADRLRAHLAKIIAEARAEDTDAAHVFLAQHGQDSEIARPAPRPASKPVSRPVPDPVPQSRRVEAPAPDAQPKAPPQARATLGRLFHQTRQCARDLAAQVPDTTPDDAQSEAALPLVQETLETMLETAEADIAFTETWPELTDSLRDAGELSLLMGLEGGAAGLEEAAVLLAQIRQDFEVALAA